VDWSGSRRQAYEGADRKIESHASLSKGSSIEDSTAFATICASSIPSTGDPLPRRSLATICGLTAKSPLTFGATKLFQGSTWLPATASKSLAIVDLSMKMIPQNMVGVVAQGPVLTRGAQG